MKGTEIKTATKNMVEYITDFNSENLSREVNTPYPFYNGYLDAASEIFNKPEIDKTDKSSFSAVASTIYETGNEFRLKTTLRSYCSYIELITKDRISNVALYESLEHNVENILNLLAGGVFFRTKLVCERNVYNMVFTLSSMIFNDTVDFMYRFDIPLNDNLYKELTIANIELSEAFKEDLLILIDNYNSYYSNYFENFQSDCE